MPVMFGDNKLKLFLRSIYKVRTISVLILPRTDFGAGCAQLWMQSAEQLGEHHYENRNNNVGSNRSLLPISVEKHVVQK